MKKITTLLVLCFSLLLSNSSFAQSIEFNNIEKQIDALIPTSINDTTPGLSIGIVHKGKLIFSKGYGLANMAYNIPNDSKMLYNIGSVSKQFLGYAFAMLQNEGKINIDDPVSKYLDNWPKFKHKVSIRHLLTHTSGYREAYTISSLSGRIIGTDMLSKEECLNVVRNQPELEFIPGSRYTYNSTAWVILAEIFEKVTDQSADLWVEQNILQKLGMNNSQIESYIGEVIYNAAESYSYNPEPGYKNEKSNRAIFGAADICSSIEDMAKWINHFKTANLGGKDVMNLFLEPFILNDGTNAEYALGIGVSNYRGLKRYRHTGGHEAFLTQLSYFPEQDLGIISVSNFGRKGWLPTSKIADLLLKDYFPTQKEELTKQYKLSKKDLQKISGLYVAKDHNRSIELKQENGQLKMGNSILTPHSPNQFKIKGSRQEVLINEDKNAITQLTIVNGNKQNYYKVDVWTPSETELKIYEADYWSKELETIYHLKLQNSILTINHRWLGEIPLEPISKDFFKTDFGFYVKFNRNENKEIINLSISSGRTLNVIFDRK